MESQHKKTNGCLFLVAIVSALLIGSCLLLRKIPSPAETPSAEANPNPAAGPRDTWNPEVLRSILEREYGEFIQAQYPRYNFIEVKSSKLKNGFRMLAIHSFFNEYELEAGPLASRLSSWMDKHHSELKQAKIIWVGLKGKQYSGGVGYKVP